MHDPITIRLSRKLSVIGNDHHELVLREPRGDDLVAAGYPLTFGADGRTDVNAASMNQLIARLANIPGANVGMLAACDWQAACLAVMGFFAPPAASPDAS